MASSDFRLQTSDLRIQLLSSLSTNSSINFNIRLATNSYMRLSFYRNFNSEKRKSSTSHCKTLKPLLWGSQIYSLQFWRLLPYPAVRYIVQAKHLMMYIIHPAVQKTLMLRQIMTTAAVDAMIPIIPIRMIIICACGFATVTVGAASTITLIWTTGSTMVVITDITVLIHRSIIRIQHTHITAPMDLIRIGTATITGTAITIRIAPVLL